ncbi:MAG: hypothetical protein ACTSVV_01785 [Promethearchaeota archaeon]
MYKSTTDPSVYTIASKMPMIITRSPIILSFAIFNTFYYLFLNFIFKNLSKIQL